MRLLIVGGGPAGLFAAIQTMRLVPGLEAEVIEREPEPLRKLRGNKYPLSVSKAVFEPEALAAAYPRGGLELLGMFHQWQPRNMLDWFRDANIPIEVAGNADVKPVNGGEAFADALLKIAKGLGIRVHTGLSVTEAHATTDGFRIWTRDGPSFEGNFLLLASGGQGGGFGYGISQHFGHTVVPTNPALTVLHTKDSRFRKLQNVVVPEATAKIPEFGVEAGGGVELLPKGLGGRAVLSVASLAAAQIIEKDYTFLLEVNWVPVLGTSQPTRQLLNYQLEHPKREVAGEALFNLPLKLWERLAQGAKLEKHARWGSISRSQIQALAGQVVSTRIKIDGKSINKSEWVSSGGVNLAEVDPRTMQSKLKPGLFFAGEMLNIDGLPGGYNLQAAWTTGHIAALGIREAATTRA